MNEQSHPSHDDYDEEGLATVRELIGDVRIAMLTSVDHTGGLVSRPMAVQEAEFDGDLWFFSEADSPKVANVTADPSVNVALVGDSSWVSLKGEASVVRDVDKKTELWNSFVESWFTEGPESDAIVLLRVHAESAEYWDSPGTIGTGIAMLKTKVTGGTPDAGENKTVQLD
ncbi:MAG: pyridoxamine 5'-phosphate oxidase family protein [Ornithinimicrobium sp.]